MSSRCREKYYVNLFAEAAWCCRRLKRPYEPSRTVPLRCLRERFSLLRALSGRGSSSGHCRGPDALALCRHVRGRTDYLLRTWHPSTRPSTLDLERESVRWLGLQVRRVEAGGVGDRDGVVEFVARYKIGGRAHRLHETSRFVREDGRWFSHRRGGLNPRCRRPVAVQAPFADAPKISDSEVAPIASRSHRRNWSGSTHSRISACRSGLRLNAR